MRPRLLSLVTLAAVVSILGAACNAEVIDPVTEDEPLAPTPSTAELPARTGSCTPSPESTVGAFPPEAADVVALARADLAQRLDVEREVIRVISVEDVTWSDASLGCPEPGETYAQVVTPGFRIVLEASRERVVYHTDREETVVLCEEKSVMDSPTASERVESGLDSLIQSAKEDLAQRLSIKPEQIEVVEARSVVWPDASMGCPQSGMRYKQVPQDGALIRLRAEGCVYEYHSGGTREPFLCEQPTGTPKSTSPELDLSATPPNSDDS